MCRTGFEVGSVSLPAESALPPSQTGCIFTEMLCSVMDWKKVIHVKLVGVWSVVRCECPKCKVQVMERDSTYATIASANIPEHRHQVLSHHPRLSVWQWIVCGLHCTLKEVKSSWVIDVVEMSFHCQFRRLYVNIRLSCDHNFLSKTSFTLTWTLIGPAADNFLQLARNQSSF